MPKGTQPYIGSTDSMAPNSACTQNNARRAAPGGTDVYDCPVYFWAHSDHRVIAVPSVTRCHCCRCRCCCRRRCAGGVRQWRRATVATPGEWQCKTGGVQRLAVANGPNIFQMLLVCLIIGNRVKFQFLRFQFCLHFVFFYMNV